MAGLTSIILISGALLAGDGTQPFDRSFDHPQQFGVQGPRIHGQHQLRPLDQAVADTSPLSISLRQVDSGLAMPVDFERVYRLPGDGDRLVRAQGGLYAVFPRSVYMPTEFGDLPLIPADTVFHIGSLPTARTAAGQYDGLLKQYVLMSRGRQDDVQMSPAFRRLKIQSQIMPQRAEARPGHPADASRERAVRNNRNTALRQQHYAPHDAEPIEAPGTITGDPSYRADRLATLLERAAEAAKNNDQAARGRSSSPSSK